MKKWDAVDLNTEGLDRLVKALKGKLPSVQVGVLGKAAVRVSDDNESGEEELNNATIGAKHEYGVDVPERSFLRMPLSEKLDSYLEQSGSFTPDVLKEVVREGTIGPWLMKIGIIGETVVQDAFDTGGFGNWKPSNMKYKKVHQTLVETGQLRGAISSRLKV